eukprot:3174868-Pyramimonas_sp.AAC.1
MDAGSSTRAVNASGPSRACAAGASGPSVDGIGARYPPRAKSCWTPLTMGARARLKLPRARTDPGLDPKEGGANFPAPLILPQTATMRAPNER